MLEFYHRMIHQLKMYFSGHCLYNLNHYYNNDLDNKKYDLTDAYWIGDTSVSKYGNIVSISIEGYTKESFTTGKIIAKVSQDCLPYKTQYGLCYNNSDNKVFVLAVTEEGNILSELDGLTSVGTIIFGDSTWIRGSIIYISK